MAKKRGHLVDFEKLFFLLKEDPRPYRKYRTLKDGDKERTQHQIDRAFFNNIQWAEDIVPKMIMQTIITAKIIKQQLKEKMGLDAWT